jgi:hypothetical protein
VIDVIKAAGQDNLLRELRASVISVHTLSNMYFLPGQTLKFSEPLEQLPHSGPSEVATFKINVPSVAKGIVNQYIQLLECQGEPFEIESEDVKRKRKRLVKAKVEKSEDTKEGGKGKTKTKAGCSKVVVVQDVESEDDDEPLSVRQKKLVKEPKKRNVEGSSQDNSGNVSMSKPAVVNTQETQPTPSSTQPSNSPLQFLEQHLGGELSNQTIPTNLVQNPSIHPISEQTQNPI